MSSYASRLKKMNEEYKETKSQKGGGSRPPAGKYHMRVEKAFLEENKKTKHLQVLWQLVIVGGEQDNRKAFKRNSLEGEYSEMGLGILKGDMETLGHPMKNIIHLIGKNGLLQKTIGTIIETALVDSKNPKFYNLFFNGLVEEMPTSDDLDAAQPDDTKFEGQLESSDPDEIDLDDDAQPKSDDVDQDSAELPDDESKELDQTDPANWAMGDVETVEA